MPSSPCRLALYIGLLPEFTVLVSIHGWMRKQNLPERKALIVHHSTIYFLPSFLDVVCRILRIVEMISACGQFSAECTENI
jgi:hypothetical protein